MLRNQPVLHREQARRHPVGDADLAVDVLDVVADGLRTDDELGCDLLVRQPAHREPQDLDLAWREVAWSMAPAATVPRDLQHGGDLVFKGEIGVAYDTGRSETIGAGRAFYAPAGHTSWRAAAGTEMLMFSPSDLLAEVDAAIAAMMQSRATAHSHD